MRKPKGKCAYCGAAGIPLERGHVVPKCLYPLSRCASKFQRITVPECASCNRGWSDDEAHFRAIAVLAGKPNQPVREVWDTKVSRSLYEVDGQRRLRDLLARMVPVTVEGQQRQLIYPGKDERVLRIVKKIVRGLSHYHGIESQIDESRVIADVLKRPVNEKTWALGASAHSDPEIFWYWRMVCNGDLSSLWILTFYSRLPFIASVRSLDKSAAAERQPLDSSKMQQEVYAWLS